MRFCLQITTFDGTKGDDSLIYTLWFRVRSPGVLYSSNFVPSSDHTCEFEEHTYCQNLLDIHEMSCLSLMIVKIFMFCFLSCPQLGLFTKQLGNKSFFTYSWSNKLEISACLSARKTWQNKINIIFQFLSCFYYCLYYFL